MTGAVAGTASEVRLALAVHVVAGHAVQVSVAAVPLVAPEDVPELLADEPGRIRLVAAVAGKRHPRRQLRIVAVVALPTVAVDRLLEVG